MATKVADRVLLDTNILLAATDEGRAEHGRALIALNEWPAAGTALYTSGQSLREYFCVATRAVRSNGLGLAQADAVANVKVLRARLRFLDETDKVAERLVELLSGPACEGKQVHDANVVATAIVHGIGTIVTMNHGDFVRFGNVVSVIDLLKT